MISISIFGFVFLPIALLVFFFRPAYLVALLVFSSVFAAASVIDVTTGDSVFGLQPYYFVAALVAIRALPVFLAQERLRHSLFPSLRKTLQPLTRFWKWGVLSAIALPLIFHGMRVIDPRSESGDAAAAFAFWGETRPLHLSFGNLGQAVYLSLNFIAIVYVLRPHRDRSEAFSALWALQAGVFIVGVIAFLQSVLAWKGWEFPYSFFNGNPAYAQAFEAELEDVRRVSSTFTEASTAGGFLSAGALGLLAMRLSGKPVRLSFIFLAIGGLILTTATTGYLAFVIGVLCMLGYFAYSSGRGRLSGQIVWRSLIIMSVLLAAIVTLLVVAAPLRQAALETTFNKADTYSFLVRRDRKSVV